MFTDCLLPPSVRPSNTLGMRGRLQETEANGETWGESPPPSIFSVRPGTYLERKGKSKGPGAFKIVITESSHLLLTGAPGEIKRSRDLRGGRWSWTLNYAQKRSWAGLSKLDVFCFELSKLFVNSGATDIVLVTVQHSSWKSNCAVHKSLGNGEGTPP